MITTTCPACSNSFLVDHQLENQLVECGNCEHRFIVKKVDPTPSPENPVQPNDIPPPPIPPTFQNVPPSEEMAPVAPPTFTTPPSELSAPPIPPSVDSPLNTEETTPLPELPSPPSFDAGIPAEESIITPHIPDPTWGEPAPPSDLAEPTTPATSNPAEISPMPSHPEKQTNDLSGFSKTFESLSPAPAQESQDTIDKIQQAERHYLPKATWKKGVSWIGWGCITLGILLLVLGSIKGGFLTDTTVMKRMIFAGFFSLSGMICLFLGCRSAKAGLGYSFISFASLLPLAYFLPVYETPTRTGALPTLTTSTPSPTSTRSTIDEIKEACNYETIEAAISNAMQAGKTKENIIAIWIEGDSSQYQHSIQDFFRLNLELESRPSFYNRKEGVLIVSDQLSKVTFTQAVDYAEKVGIKLGSYRNDRLIHIRMRPEKATLNSSELHESDFYVNNIRAIQHFDSYKVIEGLSKLETAEPRYTGDAFTVFLELIHTTKHPEILAHACACMQSWGGATLPKHKDKLEKAARFEERGANEENWPQPLVSLLLSAGSERILPLSLAKWQKNPSKWESAFIKCTQDYSAIIKDFAEPENRTLTLSVIHILKSIDSEESKNSLAQLKESLGASYASAF